MAQMKKLSLAIASLCLFGASAAHAVDLQAGDWKLSVTGEVNGFLTSNSCDKNAPAIVLGLACQGHDTLNINNGLLPNDINFVASTRQDDLDISATIGLYPTIDTNTVGATGGSNLNTRQGFLTFGDKSWGSVKIGRDLGIFGSDAILSDMSLLSVGAASAANNNALASGTGYGAPTAPTTLGRIGAGYVYADWIPQVTYSSPNLNGLNASVGVFQGLSNTSSSYSNKQPGIQGKASYDLSGSGVNTHLWAGFLTQQNEAGTTAGGAAIQSYNTSAFELGAKADIGDFQALGYYYNGDGLGTTLIAFGGDDGLGNKRKSDGGYVQGTYKIGKVKLGLSYGESKLKTANAADAAANGNLVSKNESSIASLYYSLTKNLTLVGEYVNTKSTAQAGASAKQDTVAVGGILFF